MRVCVCVCVNERIKRSNIVMRSVYLYLLQRSKMLAITQNICTHDGKCTVCQLCQKANAKMKHPGQMIAQAQFKDVYAWLKKYAPSINDAACLCLPCVKQIQRNYDKKFIPRWLPKPPVPTTLRCVIWSIARVLCAHKLSILKAKVTAFTCTSEHTMSIGLCREHYNRMYMSLHAPPCDTCLTKPRKGETFSRHCSSPEVVNEYLSHISAECSALTSESRLCFYCYKYFQSIISQVKGEGKQLVSSAASIEIQTLQGKGENIESIDFYEMVMCIIAKNLIALLKADEAVLLSTLYKSFVDKVYSESTKYTLCDPRRDSTIPQKRWVLSRLYRHFGDILTVTCRHSRYGTLLYHKNCDLVNALSAALGRNKMNCMPITDANDKVKMPQNPGCKPHPSGISSVGPECICNCSIEKQIGHRT